MKWNGVQHANSDSTPKERRALGVRAWRRRVLLKRGAQLRLAMGRNAQTCGRLQGFSYLTGACDGPATDVPVSQSSSSPQDPVNDDSRRRSLALSFRPVQLRRVSQLAPALLLAFSTSLAVAAPPSALPEHARASRHGSGWDCLSGFRRVGDTCARIAVPANAYLDASGRGWRCDRGYLHVAEACVAVKVPQNAYMDDSYGKGWRCNRDYREANGACVAIQIPANAHSIGTSYGSGWECNRGFRLVGAQCPAVVVPAQGFLSHSGDNWECERGFMKAGAACVAVQLPANAHLDYSGNDWTCDDGFRQHGSVCEAG